MAVFTSIETPDFASSLVVEKKSTHLEPFQRDILLISIYDSLKHRKDALREASDLADTAIQQIVTSTAGPAVPATAICSITVDILGKFDHAAAVHYSAYFLD